jgi:hypothetical protein
MLLSGSPAAYSVWLLVCLLLAYAPDIGRGFVADDFGWIYFSRIRSWDDAWRLLVDGAPGFYRPVVALSFGVNELLFGLWPIPYAITNLLLALAIAGGIVWLAVSLGLPAVAGVFGAGLWILNFHGISMALMWISGRTSLLTTMFAIYGAVALVRRRPLTAGWLTLAALLSKEEPIMLPVVFVLWLAIDRFPAGTIARMTWPSFAALAAYLALRARTDAFTPATAPSFYRLSASPDVLLPNTLGYLDRSLTFTTAVLLLGWLLFARTGMADLPPSRRRRFGESRRSSPEPLASGGGKVRPTQSEWRTLLKGIVWLVLGFAVTIMIPVRSSLYVVFPTIGSALIGMAVGGAIWRSLPDARRPRAAAALLLLPILVLPIHWSRHRTTKDQAVLSARVMERAQAALAERPHATRLIVIDEAGARPTISSAFGSELQRALELAAGRALSVDLVQPGPPVETHRAEGALILRLAQGAIEVQ